MPGRNAVLLGVLLWLAATGVLAASNLVRVQLGHGASMEVPRNWVVLSGNQRITVDTFVEAKGFRLTESDLAFAANLYDDRGKTMALINARLYPENTLTQVDARSVTEADLPTLEGELRKAADKALAAMGARITTWRETRMGRTENLAVLIHEHVRSDIGGSGPTTVRGIRVWNSPRSFTVTLSYRESQAHLLRPIIDRMTQSIRQG